METIGRASETSAGLDVRYDWEAGFFVRTCRGKAVYLLSLL